MNNLLELLLSGTISIDQLNSRKVRVRYIGDTWECADCDHPKNNDIGTVKFYRRGDNNCLVHFSKRSGGRYNGSFSILLRNLVLAPRKNNF